MPPPDSKGRSAPPSAKELSRALDDLGVEATQVQDLETATTHAPALLATISPGELPTPERLHALRQSAASKLSADGHLLIHLGGRRTLEELARWRDGIWPDFHLATRFSFDAKGDVTRILLQGSTPLAGDSARRGSIRVGELLCARPCDHVRSPALTQQKFDTHAAEWNGTPGAAGYIHHRWMRRFVARFAPRRNHRRILDFGCGAGWVGIEACLHQRADHLRFFDPSPEMVRIATENATDAGISNAAGTTGFGEAPPYPTENEAPFDLVLSSGVLSFARDLEAFYDGLARTVAPGGTLILGDLHASSLGMRRRRARRPLLPIRELAATTPTQAAAAMIQRGFRQESRSGYQLTDPFPQLLHLDSTNLHGALSHPLTWCNHLASRLDRTLGAPFAPLFDSWVLRLTRE
jgi:SAM-dependent methyltransferase